MKHIFWTTLLAATFSVLAADNLVKNGEASSGLALLPGVETIDNGPNGVKCFATKGNGKILLGVEYIEIDPEGTYELSGNFCGEGDDKANHVDFGLALYDKNKQLITHSSMDAMPESEAVLAEDVAKGAKELKLKDTADWASLVKKGGRIVAMGAEEDYSDLPNRNLCYYVTKLDKKGDILCVELSTPAYKGYPAGTKVRLHKDGGYQWCLLEFSSMTPTWKNYKARISGTADRGTPRNQFWKTTRFARLALCVRKDQKVFFDKISLKRVDEVPEGMVAATKPLVPESDANIITTPMAAWPHRRFAQKADGSIVIEAEAPWEFTASKLDIPSICEEKGCGGGRFMQHCKNATYPFTVEKPGTYKLFHRQRVPFSGEWCHTMVLDGKSLRITDSIPATFPTFSQWNWNGTQVVELTEGKHTLSMDFQGGAMLDQIAFIPVDSQLAPKTNEPLSPQFENEGLSGEALYGGFLAGPRYSNAILAYKVSGKGTVNVTSSLDNGGTWFKVSPGDRLPDCTQNTPLLVKVAISSKTPDELPMVETLRVNYLVSTELPPEKSRLDKSMETTSGKIMLQPAKWSGARWQEDELHFSKPLVQDKEGCIFAKITDADNMVLAPKERSWLEKDERLGGEMVLHQGRLNSNLVSFDFTLKEHGKYRPYFLMRMVLPTTAIIMEFNRPENVYLKYGYSIDNKRVEITGAGKGAPPTQGAYYKGTYYWCGGNPTELAAGEHCLRLLWGMHYMNCAAIALVPEGEKAKAPEKTTMPKSSARQLATTATIEYAEVEGRLISIDCEESNFEISFDSGKTFVPLTLPMKERRAFVLRGHFKGAIPTVTAQLAQSAAIALQDKDQRLLFDRTTGNLTGYFLTDGRPLLPEGCNLPLFNFQIGTQKAGYRQIAPEPGNLVERSTRKEGTKQVLTLKYALCNEQVAATVTITVEDGQLPQWELAIDNASKEDIRHITFPTFRDVRLCSEPENSYFTSIRNLCAFGWPGASLGGRGLIDGPWPGSYSMGYAEMYAKGIGSFTIQNRNPNGIGVHFTFKPNAGGSAVRMSTTRYYMVEAGKSATVKYAAGYYNGDEHDVCELYGKWAHTWMDFSQVNRPIAKNVTACTHAAYYPPDRTENQMIPLYRWLGYEMHWLVWGRVGYTHLYCPNYGTPEAVSAQHQALAEAGQPAIQYWDHYGWSLKYETEPTIKNFPKDAIPFIETLAKPGIAEKAGNRNEFGRLCVWNYAPPDCTMCTASHEWTDYAIFVMHDHYFTRYKLSGIYADESCVYVNCHNTAHDHGKQYGMKMVGLGRLFTAVHEKARQSGRDCIINGEGSPDYLLQFEEMGLRSGADALDGAPLLFAFPEIKFFRGEGNHPQDGVPNWDEALRDYHLIARSDVPVYAGNARHFIMHRDRIKDWMYNGVFRDDVGLEPSCVGIIAKYFLRNGKDYCGLLVNIRNEEKRAGAKLRFRRNILPADAELPVNALAYLMEGQRTEPVAIEQAGEYFSVSVPADRALSLLIPVRMPAGELVRADLIWPQQKGPDVLRISLMNFGEGRVEVPLKLALPKGLKVTGLPTSVSLRSGEYRLLEVPLQERESLLKLESITLDVNDIHRKEYVLPTICNGSFESHTGKTMAADYWGTNPQYYIHAMQQLDGKPLDKQALGGILDESAPYKGRYALRLPARTVPLPFPKTLAGPYGRFNYPKETARLPWYYNSQQNVVLKPATKYRLTFAIRFGGDEGELRLQSFAYSERQGQVSLTFKPVTYKPEVGDREWSVKELAFETPDTIFNCTQTPVVFVNMGTTDVWVDEVSIRELQN
ncbi:MAG: hypothetical protein IKP00_01080 [Victivallales bacterium]|nr:hypothetical protein [Victivallales bacterium]